MTLAPLNKSRVFHLNSLPSVFGYNLGSGNHGHISRLEERSQEGKVSVLWMEGRTRGSRAGAQGLHTQLHL